MAAVAPLVGLALLIDVAIVINQQAETAPLTAADRALAKALVYSNTGLLVLAESAALYSVGADVRTTFLLVTATVPVLVQLWLLTEAALFKMHILKLTPG